MKTSRILILLAIFVLALSTSFLLAQTPTEQPRPATDTTAPLDNNIDRPTTQQEDPPANRDTQPLTDQGANTATSSSNRSPGTLSNPEANPNMINPRSNDSSATETTGTSGATSTTTTTTTTDTTPVADPTLKSTTTTTTDTTGTTNDVDANGLPKTASPLPLLALLAFGAAGAAFGLRKAQQR